MWLVVGCFLAIAFLDIGFLVKRTRRELVVYGFFFAFVFILTLLQTMGVQIPSPIMLFDVFLKEIHLSY
jgi:hypothetical protein